MTRHIVLRRLSHAAFGLAPLVVPVSVANDVLTLAPESRLWVNGTSTVRSFECKAAVLDADVTTNGPGAVQAIFAAQKAVRAVQVAVPAQRLDCSNGTMNSHMYKALKASEHGTIAFELASYELAKAADGMRGTITGELTLGGVTKPITFTALGTEQGDQLRVIGSYQLKMTDYGLKPPTLMMGAMKVHDPVTVSFDLLLKD